MLLTSCSLGGGNGSATDGFGDGEFGGNKERLEALPFPEGSFTNAERKSVIGSIIQTGDGNAYVNGSVSSIQSRLRTALSSLTKAKKFANTDKQLVTLEHNFGYSCYVSGYIGNSLYIIQDFGSLALNKKGVGHKDGTVILEYGEGGYFSISSFSENKIIVGNPEESAIGSAAYADSFSFGYMTYDEDKRELKPMYEENNLRFYTAGYFIDGVALVSVKEDGKILFGVIDSDGNYVVEPAYEMMADEPYNSAVIVAKEAKGNDRDEVYNTASGRSIIYNSTLMTDVQGTRQYECTSKTVGIIDTHSGNAILPCAYSYVERVSGGTYFVIDGEGNRSLFNSETGEFTKVESGAYAYYNSEWMMYVDENGFGYLADKDLNLYGIDGLNAGDFITQVDYRSRLLINTNVISAICDAHAIKPPIALIGANGVIGERDMETWKITVTVEATGEVFEDVDSYTEPYNGAFFFTNNNSLYRYDMKTATVSTIETGYGNFTVDYDNLGVEYCTAISMLDDGVFILRYEERMQDGRSYHMIIVNDKGTVLFEASINSVENLMKNYLGKYDDALYSIAGKTNIEDNYYVTKTDGSHVLLQLVRGDDGEVTGGETASSYTRTIDDLYTFSFLSPFKLDFTDGTEIKVTAYGVDISSEYYVYDSAAQSLKFLSKVFDSNSGFLIDKYNDNDAVEFTVTAGGESVTLVIERSPYAVRH